MSIGWFVVHCVYELVTGTPVNIGTYANAKKEREAIAARCNPVSDGYGHVVCTDKDLGDQTSICKDAETMGDA